jgi:hypothetical protein
MLQGQGRACADLLARCNCSAVVLVAAAGQLLPQAQHSTETCCNANCCPTPHPCPSPPHLCVLVITRYRDRNPPTSMR